MWGGIPQTGEGYSSPSSANFPPEVRFLEGGGMVRVKKCVRKGKFIYSCVREAKQNYGRKTWEKPCCFEDISVVFLEKKGRKG